MPLVAANWKMNPTNIDDALDLARGILAVARGHADRVEVVIVPPFPWLIGVSEVLDQSGVKLGAQDCFWEMMGAGAGREVRVRYGGSVNWKNVQQYVELPLCDGALVGGASLDADEFAHIVKVTAEVYGHR